MKTINEQTLSEVNEFEVNKLSSAVSGVLGTTPNKINEILEKNLYSDVLEKAEAILTEGQLREMFKDMNSIPDSNTIPLAKYAKVA